MDVEVKSFFDNKTATWTYVIFEKSNSNKKCAVIDSVLGFDISSGRIDTKSADIVIDFIKDRAMEVEWILETHIHADHLTAAKYIKEKLGGKTAISKHILKVLKAWLPIFNSENDIPIDGSQFDYLFEDNEIFKIGDIEAKVIHTPGHTPADTSYVIGDAVFVGDTIFMPDVGTGRCDFPGGSASDSYDSIKKLFRLPDNYRIFVGHDYPPQGREVMPMTTISEQKKSNIRINDKVSKNEFINKRNTDDVGMAVPKLLLPSIQVNLRSGGFGNSINGIEYIKIPINKI